MIEFLKKQNIPDYLIDEVIHFRNLHPASENLSHRIVEPRYHYIGRDVWIKALTAMINGENLLLSGPKATGKNVLAENLAYVFGRPTWNVSFHAHIDAQSLLGSDTFVNNEVVLRDGPILQAAKNGGFALLDEINMAKSDAIAVLHSVLDYRRAIDVPGYDRVAMNDATRFIATMNYGYIGTKELNEALISRFLIIDMPVMNRDDIKNLLLQDFPLTDDAATRFAQLFYDLQEKSLHGEISSKAIDMRGLIAAIRAIQSRLDVFSALDMGIVHKSFDPFEQQVIRDVIHSIFPKQIDGLGLFE